MPTAEFDPSRLGIQGKREIVTSVGCVDPTGTALPFGCVASVDPTGIQPPFGCVASVDPTGIQPPFDRFADVPAVSGVLFLSTVLPVFVVSWGLDFSGPEAERFEDINDCTSINTLGLGAIALSHSLVL